MAVRKTIDQYEVGEELEPNEFHVSEEFNQRYLDALEDHHPRYVQGGDTGGPMVHPGILLNQSNSTRSPSHLLPDGWAAIHSKEEVEFLAPARVGKTFRVHWKLLDKYVKRGRDFTVTECLIVDEDGVTVVHRKMTGTISQRRN